MSLAIGIIEADSVSNAWLGAARQLAHMPGHKAVHLVVRIGDPLEEDQHVRDELDRVMRARGDQSIATVANTLFPHALAQRYPEPTALAEHYRDDILPKLRRLARPKNAKGTYFGRLVAYPGASGQPFDQLSATVAKLRREVELPGPLSSCYEMAVDAPSVDDVPGTDVIADDDLLAQRSLRSAEPASTPSAIGAASGLTYSGERDNSARIGFPCLSMVSFHLDGAKLHLAAHYRNQHFIERAYGNYLGLGQLLGYVAAAAGLEVGELLVVAGHALLEQVAPVRPLLDGDTPLPLEL